MTSNWALPTNIIQYSEEDSETSHVQWTEIDNFYSLKNLDGKFVKTQRDLLHIARDPKKDLVEKTYFLKLTGFNFINIPSNISGFEVKITMNRFGRITDDTIQLCLNDKLIGDNKANLDLAPIKIYGNENDLWETNISNSGVINNSFGIVLRFMSHPRWPHKNSAMIDTVQIRIH
jgi:hypothetical protein